MVPHCGFDLHFSDNAALISWEEKVNYPRMSVTDFTISFIVTVNTAYVAFIIMILSSFPEQAWGLTLPLSELLLVLPVNGDENRNT